VKNIGRRERLTPDYRMGCKRILLSNDFYAAMDRANVELVTEHVKEIRPSTVVGEDGVQRRVDCIIFATGFAATDFLVPMKVTGLRADRTCINPGKVGRKRISA
jgi:cation diffusion facilitator CzcD-associated flavoprotein CzcO